MSAVAVNDAGMVKRKTDGKQTSKSPPSNADRHKARVIIGIPAALADVLQPEADRQFKSLTGLIVDICREHAERSNLLPKPDSE